MRRRRVGALLLAAGTAMLVTSFAAVAHADDQPSLGFFDVSADTTGIGASFGDPTSQPYPVAAGLVPNAVAQLAAGPSGRAMSSVAWPGPLLGNAGTLANVIGTPLPPEVVTAANDPVVAQASAGAGGHDAHSLGPMSAAVDGGDSRASTALTDVAAPGVVTAARVVTTSHSYLDGGKVIAVGETELEGVEVAGVVKIARVRTIARGASDGVQASTAQDVTLAGVTVNDQRVTIDEDGIHVPGGSVPLGAGVAGAKPVLDGLGMTAFVTKPRTQQSSGGDAALDSGSVVFQWSPPGSGQYFTVVLGGSSVTLRATPSTTFDTATDALGAPSEPGAVLPTPAFAPAAGAGAAGPVLPAGASPSATATPAVGAPLQSGATLDLTAALTDRVPFGWVLVGIVGACLVGSGLHRFREEALGAALAGTRCPLERRSP